MDTKKFFYLDRQMRAVCVCVMARNYKWACGDYKDNHKPNAQRKHPPTERERQKTALTHNHAIFKIYRRQIPNC